MSVRRLTRGVRQPSDRKTQGIVALPLAGQTRPARLTLATVGPAQSERIASHGRSIEPTTAEQHHSARARQAPDGN